MFKEHPVLKAIVQRQGQGSVPGRRQDGFRIGLAIEGGAMRGVVSAGMVAGLEQLGLLPAFDVVYGTSAGAINGAYFVAGQAAYGASIYYENINNSQFVSRLRLLCGDPLVSLEFLFEHVMIREKTLDWRRVLDSPIELVPVAASLRQAQPALLRGARSRYDLFLRLKASARIPLLAGPPVSIDGEDYLDGGLFAPFPVRLALQENCTHVLALLTRPVGAISRSPNVLTQHIFSRELAKYNPDLKDAFLTRGRRYARELDWLEIRSCAPTCSPHVYAVQPPRGAPLVQRFETRCDALVSGADGGMGAILDLFGTSDLNSSCSHKSSEEPVPSLDWSVDLAENKPLA
jgi:predicted patatin/cPLA2 family phospholipase